MTYTAWLLRRLLPLLLIGTNVSARLVITEIYRDPPGTETALGGGGSHEFIELTNLGPDTIPLEGIWITNGRGADTVMAVEDTIPGHHGIYNAEQLEPGEIAVILDPDYRAAVSQDSRRSFDLRLSSTVLLTIGDDAFGGSGLAGTHGIACYRGTRNSIDTLLCIAADRPYPENITPSTQLTLSEPENREGYSLHAEHLLDAESSVAYRLDEPSPGIYPPLIGDWLTEMRLKLKEDGTTVSCSLMTRAIHGDVAKEDVQLPTYKLIAYHTGNDDIIAEGKLTRQQFRALALFNVAVDSLRMQLLLATETRPQPAWTFPLSTVWLPEKTIRITEIFPKSTTGEPEWFELTNVSEMPVSLRGWSFCSGGDTIPLCTGEVTLAGQTGTAVITGNAALLSTRYPNTEFIYEPDDWNALSDAADTIALLDARGTLREQICYDKLWFDNWSYLSIERNSSDDGCSRDSWVVVARSTPGTRNGAIGWRDSETPSMEIAPIPFIPYTTHLLSGASGLSADHSDRKQLTIKLQLPPAAHASLAIYGFDGRILKKFATVTESVTFWDGYGTGGKAPSGPFFVVATIKEGSKTTRIRKKGILWQK